MGGVMTGVAKRTERMAAILDAVAARGEMSLAKLADLFATSEATMRRDLTLLADQGVIVRVHGGARAKSTSDERPVGLRGGRFAEAKLRIARAAANSIPRGRSAIALSGGTTTSEVARELGSHGDLTIVTNSLSIASVASSFPALKVVMTGGILRPQSLELVGVLAENTFVAVNVGIAILGADGVSAEAGFTTHDEVEARTNHAMVQKAARTIVVADGSKIGRSALAQMAALAEVDLLITDDSADPYELAALAKAGVDILLV